MATHCKRCNVVGVHEQDGSICCPKCGRVLVFNILCEEPTFITSSNGQSRLSGNLVKSIESTFSESYERTLRKGEDEIRNLVQSLDIGGGEDIVREASKFHRIAVDRSFTKGRVTSLVTGSCLYIACRIKRKPYLLIDFSDSLNVSVYELGAVFIQLCKLLRLERHSDILVDPVLFLPRFAKTLLPERNNKVEKTAMKILASMKRDWMQTGRKPSGLCGAALYIAALSFGIDCKKSEIASVVHMCEDTLTKRLIEFENTYSASLTMEEFTEKEEDFQFSLKSIGGDANKELLCKHKGSGDPHFSNGLCENCYNEFVDISGGIHGGSDPPAFQCAERNRLKTKDSPDLGQYQYQESERDDVGSDESESLSDIDVDEYIHDKEEARMKKIIWEKLNSEYIDEQAMKDRMIQETLAKLQSYSDRVLTPEELVAATSAAIAQSKKEKRQKRAEEVKNTAPAKTAAEAVSNMFMKKRLNSKINYDVLNKLFDDDDDDDKNSKKSTESNAAKRKSSEFDDIQENKKRKSEDDFHDDEIEEVENASEIYDDTYINNWDEEHEQYGNGMYYGDEGDNGVYYGDEGDDYNY